MPLEAVCSEEGKLYPAHNWVRIPDQEGVNGSLPSQSTSCWHNKLQDFQDFQFGSSKGAAGVTPAINRLATGLKWNGTKTWLSDFQSVSNGTIAAL